MSIISQTLLTFLSAGDRLVVHRCVYDNVMKLLRNHLTRLGIDVAFVDMTDPATLRAALAEKPANVVHFEPYVNPTCEVLDAPALIRAAKDAGALCIVDNTWLTPYLFQPLRHGADLVIHSATKYLGGHGSVMGGIICGAGRHVTAIRETMSAMGGHPPPVRRLPDHAGREDPRAADAAAHRVGPGRGRVPRGAPEGGPRALRRPAVVVGPCRGRDVPQGNGRHDGRRVEGRGDVAGLPRPAQTLHALGQPGRRGDARLEAGSRAGPGEPAALAARYPQFTDLSAGKSAILDREGGFLRPELAIASHCRVALAKGAHIGAREPVTAWESDDAGIHVTTEKGRCRGAAG